ncbi:AbrB/MazE/SpoVT family DNA-binding domain-containing protein [Patescibacteria group bacterium]|nr:AbrB/MazE/SpoVT family DNA-binding domain-containing protein [Patescibacteria group bacterium]
MTTIVKATTKGQITLPIRWRQNFPTDRYIIKEKGGKLEIAPFNLERLEKQEEYTVFDAIRDNKGKGIRAKDLVKALKKAL